MKINDELYLKKKEFVAKMSELLNMAKPHLTCEFKLGEELPIEDRYVTKETENGIEYTQVKYQPSGEFVIVTAKNGYQYKVNVTCDSLSCMAEEVFRAMAGK